MPGRLALDRRPHQAAARSALYAAIKAGYRAPILVMPTGGGKTFVGCDIIRDIVSRGKRALFVVHRQELLRQTSAKLRELGIAHGIIMAGCIAIRTHAVQVASIQTLRNRMDLYDAFDVIFIDECHRATAESYMLMRQQWPDALLIGLTATPTRLDGRGLGTHAGGLFDTIVPTVTPAELIEAGYLVPYEYYCPDPLDDEGIATVRGDYDPEEAGRRVDKPKLVGSMADHYLKLGKGRPGLMFAAHVKHAYHIEEELRGRGIKALCVHAKTKSDVRRKALLDLANEELEVAVNVGLWIEGMDCPPISYIGMGRMTKSETIARQSWGRGFRPWPRKTNLIISDHAGVLFSTGGLLPCEQPEMTLDGRRRKSRGATAEFPVRQCPQCYAVVRAAVAVCYCGFRFAEAVRARTIEVSDGELVRVDTEALRARQQQGMARDRDALIAMGYSPSRADHVIQGRQEKQALRRELAELRRSHGLALKGIDDLKPKALREEIASLSGRLVA